MASLEHTSGVHVFLVWKLVAAEIKITEHETQESPLDLYSKVGNEKEDKQLTTYLRQKIPSSAILLQTYMGNCLEGG